jgi:predicted dehydrogenase
MNKIKLGIVGFGNMGSGHAENIAKGLAPHVELSAICDIDAERLNAAKVLYDVPLYEKAGEMFANGGLDAVELAVPHYFHPPMAIDAFAKGLNVMTEKPAGVYTKQVLEMNEAASKSGKVFGIMFNQRTTPMYRKIKQMVENNELGHIKKIIWIVTDWYRSQAYHRSASWRSTWAGEGGGTILNQNPHNLDLWQWMFGMPSQLTAFCSWGKYYDIECEDDVTVYMAYDNGTTGVYTTSTAETPGTNRLEISCDNGKLIAENNELTFYKNSISEREFNKINTEPFGRPQYAVEKIELPNPPESAHSVVLDKFGEVILNGGGELIANGAEGLNEMTISNAIYLSDWLGNTPIDLARFDHEQYYELLMERVKTSKPKKVKKAVVKQG